MGTRLMDTCLLTPWVKRAYERLIPILKKHGGKADIQMLIDELKRKLEAKDITEVPHEEVEKLFADIYALESAGIVAVEREIDPDTLEEYTVIKMIQ